MRPRSINQVRVIRGSQSSFSDFAVQLFNEGFNLKASGTSLRGVLDLMTTDPSRLLITANVDYPANFKGTLLKLAQELDNLGARSINVYSEKKVGFVFALANNWFIEAIYQKLEDGSWNIFDEMDSSYEPTPVGGSHYNLKIWIAKQMGASSVPKTAGFSSKASVQRKADLFGNSVKCPRCDLPMTPVKLADQTRAEYCQTCRHTDYDPQIKSKVNAGKPSQEKHIRLQVKDPGSAVLAES